MEEEDWDDNWTSHNYIYFCTESGNWEEVGAKEHKHPCRAALRDMYHDIATLNRRRFENPKLLTLKDFVLAER